MRRYSEAVTPNLRKLISPPHRPSVAQISAELGMHVFTLDNWGRTSRSQ